MSLVVDILLAVGILAWVCWLVVKIEGQRQ
jgi:hypothetical protein